MLEPMRRAFMISVFGSSVVLSGCSKSLVDAELELEASVEAILASSNTPSFSIAIVSDGEIAWEYTSGWARIDEQVPATPETLYRLASVTKLITATAVMQLVEQGLVDLDADVSDYVPIMVRNPWYPDETITPRLLLTHRSSLTGPSTAEIEAYHTDYPYDEAPALSEWLPEFILPGGSEYDPRMWKDFRPGTQKSYSNVGYGLLGYLIESVSGQSCYEYFEDHIFEPLGMYDTGVRYADMDTTKLATLYQGVRNPVEPFSTHSYTAGGVWSSIRDMTRFMNAYLNGGAYGGQRILNERTVEEILEEQFPGDITCLGWWGGDGWYGHSGGYHGHTTDLTLNFDSGAGFIILSNGEDPTVANGGELYDLIRSHVADYY